MGNPSNLASTMERVSSVGLLDFKDLTHSMYCTQLARAFGLSVEQVREEHLRAFAALGLKQLTLKDLDQLGAHPAGHLDLRTRDQQGRAFFRVVKDARGVLNYSERDEHSRAVGQPRCLATLLSTGCDEFSITHHAWLQFYPGINSFSSTFSSNDAFNSYAFAR